MSEPKKLYFDVRRVGTQMYSVHFSTNDKTHVFQAMMCRRDLERLHDRITVLLRGSD